MKMENRVTELVTELKLFTDKDLMTFSMFPLDEDQLTIYASREGLRLIAVELLEASMSNEDSPLLIDLYSKYRLISPYSLEIRLADVTYPDMPVSKPPWYETAGCAIVGLAIISVFIAGLQNIYEMIF
ncbi:MAG TPA: hypothetical protein VK154_07520 [Chitinophagales bacterium]|nr:hypothetical protein [Chitinophagales bacterium]